MSQRTRSKRALAAYADAASRRAGGNHRPPREPEPDDFMPQAMKDELLRIALAHGFGWHRTPETAAIINKLPPGPKVEIVP